jgi:hypothetical protein
MMFLNSCIMACELSIIVKIILVCLERHLSMIFCSFFFWSRGAICIGILQWSSPFLHMRRHNKRWTCGDMKQRCDRIAIPRTEEAAQDPVQS